ncbi:hypothetical protein, partial [Streptococcus pneumoniae]|uniref:hypothetical protein n=1 Tax=Streptococcus pneumoniae TaxID=1313 RepID=UPI0018B0F178
VERAVGGREDPQTNEGWLIRYLHTAPQLIQQMAETQGVTLDAEAAALMERRWQEIALDQYAKAQQRGVRLPQVFSYKQAFRGALKDASR